MALLHTILSHWPVEEVEFLLHHHNRLDSISKILLAYGGSEENFKQIKWPHKIFLNDPCLRGPTVQQNYACWIKASVRWIESQTEEIDAVFFTETDHPILRKNYGQELLRILNKSKCDFLGKWCANREGSNSYFYLRHRDDSILRKSLQNACGNEDSPIYETLATGMLFRIDTLKRIAEQMIEIPVFTEVIIPSMIRAMGFKLDCFDKHSDFMESVRFRPVYSLEAIQNLKRKGAWCCHPFKDHVNIKLALEI